MQRPMKLGELPTLKDWNTDVQIVGRQVCIPHRHLKGLVTEPHLNPSNVYTTPNQS